MSETNRTPEYKVHDHIINRWSPRAMSGEEIEKEELMSLFEAAKWAPSSFNGQPWRFLYATRNSEHWDKFFNLLMEGNQAWAKNAAVLVVMISRKTFEHNDKPNVVHSFDTGSAWENLAIQAEMNNVAVHGMAGFDYEKAKTELNIPDHYKVEAMCAIGKHGKKEDLPEKMQKMETPSDRKKIVEIVNEGSFNQDWK